MSLRNIYAINIGCNHTSPAKGGSICFQSLEKLLLHEPCLHLDIKLVDLLQNLSLRLGIDSSEVKCLTSRTMVLSWVHRSIGRTASALIVSLHS